MNVRETPHAVARAVEWEFAHSTYAQVLAHVPARLFPYWAEHAHHEFPGIPRDASFYAQSAEGLMMFFDCASAISRQCGLPSRAADSVWHAWLNMDARGLERFCLDHFGRTIPHIEKADMKGSMGEALAVCLVQARRRASKPPGGLELPRLFALDGQLGMPHGFGYRVAGGLIACCNLDEFGNPEDQLTFLDELMPYGLYRAGLISESEYASAPPGPVRQAGAPDSSFLSVPDIGVDSACGDGDRACGDGAASCGGGSCGGGCGGGGCSS